MANEWETTYTNFLLSNTLIIVGSSQCEVKIQKKQKAKKDKRATICHFVYLQTCGIQRIGQTCLYVPRFFET